MNRKEKVRLREYCRWAHKRYSHNRSTVTKPRLTFFGGGSFFSALHLVLESFNGLFIELSLSLSCAKSPIYVHPFLSCTNFFSGEIHDTFANAKLVISMVRMLWWTWISAALQRGNLQFTLTRWLKAANGKGGEGREEGREKINWKFIR